MRRALLEERQIVALRCQCADLGERLMVLVDPEGEASFLIGVKAFLSLPGALAHLDAIEDETARNAASFG